VGLYTYHDDKGRPFVELVPRETLFDSRSLESVRRGAPDVTIRHPTGLVTADNWRDTSHGTWLDAWPSGDDLGVRIAVKSPEGVAMIKDAASRGISVELSPGYEVDVADEPGQTEFGRHDGVQRDRIYNHIALLGPGEARGGTGMRLQLDGPVCAPAGCRIQSHRAPRADSKDKGVMKKLTITHADGRAKTLDAAKYGWVSGFKLDSAKADQVETGRVTIEIEGEEPSELVLPVAMIEMLLEGIGAPSAPAAAPAGMEEEAEIQGEGLDSDGVGGEEREDALSSAQLRAISRAVKAQFDSHRKAQARIDARGAEVRRLASRLLPDGYDYSAPWHQVCVDALAKVSPEEGKAAADLAKRAKSDSVSEGRLIERLAAAVRGHADSNGKTTVVEGKKIVREQARKADAKPPWHRGVPNKKEST
jgi:hypothetical protein